MAQRLPFVSEYADVAEIVSALETALRLLDNQRQSIAAAHVDLALNLVKINFEFHKVADRSNNAASALLLTELDTAVMMDVPGAKTPL